MSERGRKLPPVSGDSPEWLKTLRKAMEEEGWTATRLAEILKISPPACGRLLDPGHSRSPSIEEIEILARHGVILPLRVPDGVRRKSLEKLSREELLAYVDQSPSDQKLVSLLKSIDGMTEEKALTFMKTLKRLPEIVDLILKDPGAAQKIVRILQNDRLLAELLKKYADLNEGK